MIDRLLMDRIEKQLAQLTIPVSVIDKESIPNSDELAGLTDGVIQMYEGWLYMPVKQPAILLACQDYLPGAQDVLTLAAALMTAFGKSEARTETRYDVFRRALWGELDAAELEAMCHEHQIEQNHERCVLVFHIVQTDRDSAYDLLCDLTPLLGDDVLLDIDRHTAVLLKDMDEVESDEEIVQFVQALQETLMSETALQMTAGIGRSRHTLGEIRESYEEARKAIEVGRVFHAEESIHVFDRLILERFLTELPQEVSAYYHNLLFNRRTSRLFNEEMLYTIDMFFKKDLNLSDTARQLYIHRNTLVYRLDKVQRQTGLDLRSFDDAVTFKILMELKKTGGDRSAHK